MKAVLASHNQGKLKEMQLWLAPLGIEVVLESELGLNIDVDETGTTFEENSLLKAETVAKAAHMMVIADDSGLCVAALNGVITDAPRGSGGFGYDPVFEVTAQRKTLAEMTMEEREGCSHRAAAIRALSGKLEEYREKLKEEGKQWN